jgi:4'-phosphopantetheinyl transferase
LNNQPVNIIHKVDQNCQFLLLQFSENEPNDGKGKHKDLIENLIRNWFGQEYTLVYNEFGKPQLRGGIGFVSLSYCKNWIAIGFSKNAEIGIDVEHKRKQLENIATRFMNASELEDWQQSSRKQDYLQLVWGAKEALYKVYGRKQVVFRENLLVSGLHPAIAERFKGEILIGNQTNSYQLKWFMPDEDTYLVYVANEL